MIFQLKPKQVTANLIDSNMKKFSTSSNIKYWFSCKMLFSSNFTSSHHVLVCKIWQFPRVTTKLFTRHVHSKGQRISCRFLQNQTLPVSACYRINSNLSFISMSNGCIIQKFSPQRPKYSRLYSINYRHTCCRWCDAT